MVLYNDLAQCETVPWPSGKATDCNSVITGSNPVGTSIINGDVAESVDATDLKSVEGNFVRVQVPPSPPLLMLVQKYAPVAQLDRASDYGSEGYGFDSCRARHIIIIIIFGM